MKIKIFSCAAALVGFLMGVSVFAQNVTVTETLGGTVTFYNAPFGEL